MTAVESAGPGPAIEAFEPASWVDETASQRLLIVLSTTGAFDSRTHRIATSAAGHGHDVTVIARWEAGLPNEEDDPGGYRIVRVEASAIDGLPLPAALRRAISRRRRGHRASPARAEGPGPSAGPSGGGPRALDRVRRGARAGFGGVVRMAAIGLTVRAQARAARAVVGPADVVHGMGYMGVPVALSLAARTGGRVVYDARDIYVDANNLARLPRQIRWFLARVERGWARRADRVVTVNRAYAEVMADRWGVAFPAIVMNCAVRTTVADPRPRRFHEALGLLRDRRIVLYQGGFSPHRGIEQLIAAIRLVSNATLVLLGYGPLEQELAHRAADPTLDGRVRIVPAVRPSELLDWVASADVVAMPIQPSTLNHRLTTPNKLFEALAVGVPIVASDLPGMASIIAETGAGLVVDPTDPAAIASAIETILDGPADARVAMADRAHAAAHTTYNWESQVAILFAEYGALTGRSW